jgi:glucokinase
MFKFFYARLKVKSHLITKDEDLNTLDNKDIIENGLNLKCKVCVEVIEFFISIYGAAAGNFAILTIPTGGLYLLGGLSIALESHILKNKTFYVY